MNRLFTLLFVACYFSIQAQQMAETTTSKAIVVNESVANFHFLYDIIRKGDISESVARDSVRILLSKIKQYYLEQGGTAADDSVWRFPVEKYGMNMIGGRHGSDYISGNYNFYNSSKLYAHPAHDIFINDRNQDNLDDATQFPVNILSFSGGVVVSVEYFWDTASSAKGGNYILIYEPFSRMIYYYAHNDLVMVGLGDVVKAGQTIATMGRTGLNAFKQRSPTHLHFSMLQFDSEGFGKPIKPYTYLEKARKK